MFTPNAAYNAPYNTPFVPPSLSSVDEEDALSLFRHYLLLADQAGAHSFEAILEHTSDCEPCLSFSCDGRYEELLEYRRNSAIVPISPRREYRSPDRLDGPLSSSSRGTSEPSYTFPEIIIDIPLANDEIFRKFGHPRIFVDEVAGLFQTLGKELDMYLLFLKQVNAIELRIMGDSRITRARIPTAARGYRVALMEAQSPGIEKGFVYRTEVVRSVGTYKASTTEWCVSLHGQNPGVGIAVLLTPMSDKETDFSGRILNPLPSPSETGQPVHICGSFQSIDGLTERQENSVLSYRSSQLRELPSTEELVAECWVTFLLDISPKLRTSEAVSNDYFRYWPKPSSDGMIGKIYYHVFNAIFERNLSLWPTSSGLKGISDVFISRLIDQNTRLIVGNQHLQHLRLLEKGLAWLDFQLAHVPDDIYDTIERMNTNRKTLTPVALSVFLATHLHNLVELEDDIKGALLDYLLSRPLNKTFDYLIGIPLIPTCDGEWKSLSYLSSLKLPSDEREIRLFSKNSHAMVDIRQISNRAFLKLQSLQNDKLKGSLESWTVKDMAEYFKSFYFQNLTDQRITIDGSCLGPEFPGFVNEFWEWISNLPDSEDIMVHLEGLWLIPLEGQKYHQILPDTCSLPLNLANPSSSFGSFVLSLLERGPSRSDILVLHRDFPEDANHLLSYHQQLWDSGNFEHVIHWLSNSLDFVASLTTSQKYQLIAELANLIDHTTSLESTSAQLRSLPLFEEIHNTSSGTTTNWIPLSPSTRYIAVCMPPAVPETPEVAYLNIPRDCPAMRELLELFNLATCPSGSTLLSDYVIPSLTTGILPTHITPRLCILILENFQHLKEPDIEKLKEIPFIPCSSIDGSTRRLSRPSKCVNPSSEMLRGLFFDNEFIWPDLPVVEEFTAQLEELGMVSSISIELVLERIGVYTSLVHTLPVEEIADRAEALLKTTTEMEEIAEIRCREGRWIPATYQGVLGLYAPMEVRDQRWREVAGYALPIVGFSVGVHWGKAFGWDSPLGVEVVKRQVEGLVERGDVDGLGRVLEYLSSETQDGGYAEGLMGMKWVPTTRGSWLMPGEIFFRDFEELEPVFGTVDKKLVNWAEPLREIGVQEQPSWEKLKGVVEGMKEADQPVAGDKLRVVVAVCNVAARLYPDEDYSGFMVPDWRGILRFPKELVADEPRLAGEEVRFVHPEVTEVAVKVMGIPELQTVIASGDNSRFNSVRMAVHPVIVEEKTDEAPAPEVAVIAPVYVHETSDGELDTNYEPHEVLGCLLSYVDILDGTTFAEWKPNNNSQLFLITNGILNENQLESLVEPGGETFWKLLGTGFGCTSIQIMSDQSFILFDFQHGDSCVALQSDLPSMREKYITQLLPFIGIRDFDLDDDRFRGTVIMLELNETWDSSTMPKLMAEHVTQAETALLFAKRISSIRYSAEDLTGWKLQKLITMEERISEKSTVDTAVITRTDLQDTSRSHWMIICSSINHRHDNWDGSSDEEECEIAARVRNSGDSSTQSRLIGQLLNAQFRGLQTDLPVHMYLPDIANSLSLDNEHLVYKYFELLAHLSPQLGEAVYSFWPNDYQLFWEHIRNTDLKLFVSRDSMEPVSFREAVFDTTPHHISQPLSTLFRTLGIKVVVRPPSFITSPLGDVKNVDPAFVRDILQMDEAEAALMDICEKESFSCQTINVILEFAFLGYEQDLWDLDGCACLPLADKTLGTLRFMKGHEDEECYFVFNSRYHVLFDMIEDETLHPGLSREVIKKLLEVNCNVKCLSSQDFPRILDDVELDPDNPEAHEFLEWIWTVVNREVGFDQTHFGDLPVFIADKGDETEIITPKYFEESPAILAPMNPSELEMCKKIPGLYLVHDTTFPRFRVSTEMLQSVTGMTRFARSLSQLAFKQQVTLENFVSKVLNEADLRAMRQLCVTAFKDMELAGGAKYGGVLKMLRQLPLWENVSGKLIPAINAIILPHPKLFLSWIEVYERLILPVPGTSFNKTLLWFGVRPMDAVTFMKQYLLHEIAQHKLCEEEVNNYSSFLSAVLQVIPELPQEWSLAIDINLKYRKVDDLYDHRNRFFTAAFRGIEADKFLHPAIRKFWDKDSGLRTTPSSFDFITAAKQIQIRGLLDTGWKTNPDLQLQEDADTVYQTLCSNWDEEADLMERLLRICFIPTKRNWISHQPRFRQIRMNSLANRRPFNSFHELILPEYLDVCWSQCIFYASTPPSKIISQTPSSGIPTEDILIAHLRYLSTGWNSTTPAEAYISDVSTVYRHLATHGTDLLFNDSGRLWLNSATLSSDSFVDTPTLRVSLSSDSILNSHPRLLAVLGVHPPPSPLAELWMKGRFCDIELNISGEKVKAHRVVLAAASKYWKRIFDGNQQERELEVKGETVRKVIEWCYTRRLPTKARWGEWRVVADVWEMQELETALKGRDDWGRLSLGLTTGKGKEKEKDVEEGIGKAGRFRTIG